MLVETVIPLSTSLTLPSAKRGLDVPNYTVQKVLTTPRALSSQLTTRDWRGDSYKVPPLDMIKELDEVILQSLFLTV